MAQKLCCRQLGSLIGMPWPFGRIVALGYYDGLTSGVAECEQCQNEFRLEMVYIDDVRDIRVYTLAPLPSGSLDALVAACPKEMPPEWPMWVVRWAFPSQYEQAKADAAVQRILDAAGPLAWVLGMQHGIVIAAKPAPSGDARAQPTGGDGASTGPDAGWNAWLGIDTL